ncbi:peptide chain release factor 1 [Paracidovorax valerianellae]|uniref:Peptide chain release factor 1 n=1 Tax=Paracidovorax valerianellae TaxID=187868 RepID=A0A1G6P1Q6_9BURK|nr:peptide chain release factor 1 [Paracidovorax valerianellae]MDA8444704.1 peptide chain release factor 1 [Paracidovorax valerianellae]SDC73881.1 bacterial peptide chain release factor 1 (bRF-1) [Paracidovorax valerianellae]
MKPFLRTQLERYAQRLEELDFLLSREDIMSDMAQYRTISREHAEVTQIAGRYVRHQQREADLAGAREMLADPDMAEMAQEEIAAAEAELTQLEDELQRLLLPKDPDDARNAFVEIRAGAGGDESALFAGDLARMYTRYAATVGWKVEIMSANENEIGGYKEVVLRVEGASDSGVYGALRFESGGHRVQRVPATETQGRIHTSACTVAVMPEPDEHQAITLNPADLRIDTFRASGAGGQHINKTDSAVRVVHLPTGIVAECQDGRSQHSNKAKALQVLQARLQEKERSERAAKEAALRKGLIGSGDRSDRIRTYNFPQGRFTDHRINLTLYKLLAIMEGDLGDVLDALRHAREAEQLADLETSA